jgi:hypothetical protein
MVNNGNGYCQYLIEQETPRQVATRKCQTYIISLSLRGQPRSHSADIRNDVLRHSVKIRRRFRFVCFESSGCRSVWWSLLDGVGCLSAERVTQK